MRRRTPWQTVTLPRSTFHPGRSVSEGGGPGPKWTGLPRDLGYRILAPRCSPDRPTSFLLSSSTGVARAAGRPKSVYETNSDLQRLREFVRLLGPPTNVYARRASKTSRQRFATARNARRPSGATAWAGAQLHAGFAEMHDAVCAAVRNGDDGAFRPRGDRPVYCRTCYAATSAVRHSRTGVGSSTPPNPRCLDSVWYDGDCVGFLDQRALPRAVVRERATNVTDVVEAIRTLAVRGAPAIGIIRRVRRRARCSAALPATVRLPERCGADPRRLGPTA